MGAHELLLPPDDDDDDVAPDAPLEEEDPVMDRDVPALLLTAEDVVFPLEDDVWAWQVPCMHTDPAPQGALQVRSHVPCGEQTCPAEQSALLLQENPSPSNG